MALTKTITVGDKEVKLRASAAVPRMYRVKFGRDIYKDLHALEKSVKDNDEEASGLDSFSLELFENIAYVFNKLGDPQNVPDSVDEWLDQFETFSIYTVLPEIIDLWGLNVQSEADSRKNLGAVAGR